jgi:hypothetical protein
MDCARQIIASALREIAPGVASLQVVDTEGNTLTLTGDPDRRPVGNGAYGCRILDEAAGTSAP